MADDSKSAYPFPASQVMLWFMGDRSKPSTGVLQAVKGKCPDTFRSFSILLNQPDGYANMMAWLDEHLPFNSGSWNDVEPWQVAEKIAAYDASHAHTNDNQA